MIEYINSKKARLIVSVGSGNSRKRFYKTISYKGKRDAEKQYAEFEREVKQKGLPDNITLSELLDWHIKSVELLGVRQTTLHGYGIIKKRIIKCLGKVKAKDLTTYQIEKNIALNQEYSPKTVKETVSLLSAAYKRAITSGLLNDNPCTNVQIPKQKQADIITLSQDNIKEFINALDNESLDFKVACELALFCGMRRSEILGLVENSISDISNIITIKQGRHRIEGVDSVTTTKTDRSYRSIAVPQFVMDDVRQLIKEHHSMPYECSEFLIQNEFGEPIRPDYLSYHISIMEDKNDLPRVTFHGLRHTHATMLNASGVDIARISAQLGHSVIGTTMNIYTHIFTSELQSTKAIADSLDKVWQKDGRNSKEKVAETL